MTGAARALRVDLARVRLLSGLTLAVFIVTHLANHALGLVSLAAMEEARRWFVAGWHSWPATIALYGALALHLGTASVSLVRRRSLRMPPREAAQYVLGFGLPLLILPHVVGTRIYAAVTDNPATYGKVIGYLWIDSPGSGVLQILALLVAWVHACLGLWLWLRTRPGVEAWMPLLYGAALVVPILASMGFVSAGRELADGYDPAAGQPGPAVAARLVQITTALWLAFTALGLAVLGLRLRRWVSGRANAVRIRYPGGRVVSVPLGFSVLEASRANAIAHLSVCGARGRCSTCRVRVADSAQPVPPPDETERATLRRIGAAADVRLACQLRPAGDLSVVPLMSVAGSELGRRPVEDSAGQERQVAALFCDLRGFTHMSGRRLPFDTVYFLNRYFAAVGAAVEREGGHLDKFIGDGALALFGLRDSAEVACRQALGAAAAILDEVERLSAEMADEFDGELRVAMGLHVGPAVVGRMGYGAASSFTAIGDTINVASRLEGVAKAENASLVLSARVAERAGIVLDVGEARAMPIRGRATPLDLCILADARSWRDRVAAAAPREAAVPRRSA